MDQGAVGRPKPSQMDDRSPVGNLAIVGMGLMGGSLGMAALERGLAQQVIGFDQDPRAAAQALAKGAIRRAAPTLREAVSDADIVVIATPVGSIAEVFARAAPHLRPGTIVTDLGSTKAGIVDQIGTIAPFSVHFIGGHPVAGSEREGIHAAAADMYEGCLWILTPTQATSSEAYGRLTRFLTGLDARVLSLDPKRHDEALALTSHLPQLLSSALMSFAAEVAGSGEGSLLLTAGGFRDMTRIAGSSPDLWLDIVRQNQPALVSLVRRFREFFGIAAASLEHGDWAGLRAWLLDAQSARRALPAKPGLGPAEVFQLLVPVPDRPGVLAEVTTTVGEVGVNIEDLNIVHSAEGGRGLIHLSVKGRDAAALAGDALARKGYRVEQQ